jgi:NitT/TauT family transport system substrate-binding protein
LKVLAGAQASSTGLYVALEQGYFEDEGLEIEIEPLSTGQDQMPFLASGEAHVGFTSSSAALMNALATDIPVRMVASCGNSIAPDFGNLYLVVRKDLFDSGDVTDVADLAGRTVGLINLQGKAAADLWAQLGAEGMDFDDVNLVSPMGFGDMQAGLGSQALDAASTIEPFVVLGEESGISVPIAHDGEIMDNRNGCAVQFGDAMLQDRQLGERFLRAYLRGIRDYNDAFFGDGANKSEIVDILVKYLPVTDPVMYDKMHPFPIDPNGEIRPASLELDIEYYKSQDFLLDEPDLAEVVDGGFAEAVISELGRYE